MYLEKIIEVKTFIAPQGYGDEVDVRGFNEKDSLQEYYIKILRKLNRAILRRSEVQEVKVVMSYHKEENFTAQNSQ